MEAEYIRLEEAEQVICDVCERPICPRLWEGDCDSIDRLNKIQAADVRPVVRGTWTRVDYEPCGHDYICSECGCKSDGAWNFCPNCGADMRETGR